MSFLLQDEKPEYASWLDYFDYVIVDAAKPHFFAQGNTLREVDVQTGRLKISRVESGGAKVYSGGSIAKFEKLAGITNGSSVLYVGDHIFSDVRISKKKHGWRTFLVVPELEKELATWLDADTQQCHRELVGLHHVKAAIYRDFTAESIVPPDVKTIRKAIHQSAIRKDNKFNIHFGSLFGSGLQASFFAMQVQVRGTIGDVSRVLLIRYTTEIRRLVCASILCTTSLPALVRLGLDAPSIFAADEHSALFA